MCKLTSLFDRGCCKQPSIAEPCQLNVHCLVEATKSAREHNVAEKTGCFRYVAARVAMLVSAESQEELQSGHECRDLLRFHNVQKLELEWIVRSGDLCHWIVVRVPAFC